MQLLIATLCDTSTEDQGKLDVIGAFDAIVAQSFPASFNFTLALRFCFTAEDHGSHPFSIRLVDESIGATPESPPPANMNVNMPPGTVGCSTQNLISPLQGNVQKAGIYHFDVYFDEKILARVPFRVFAQSEIAPVAATV